jgi:hypothetical protein
MDEPELTDHELTMAALDAARQAFNARIEADGCDPAYWDIRFTAWMLSTDEFKRLRRFEIEEECK